MAPQHRSDKEDRMARTRELHNAGKTRHEIAADPQVAVTPDTVSGYLKKMGLTENPSDAASAGEDKNSDLQLDTFEPAESVPVDAEDTGFHTLTPNENFVLGVISDTSDALGDLYDTINEIDGGWESLNSANPAKAVAEVKLLLDCVLDHQEQVHALHSEAWQLTPAELRPQMATLIYGNDVLKVEGEGLRDYVHRFANNPHPDNKYLVPDLIGAACELVETVRLHNRDTALMTTQLGLNEEYHYTRPPTTDITAPAPAGVTNPSAEPPVDLLLTTVQELNRTIESVVATVQTALDDENEGDITTEDLRDVLVGELAYLTEAAELARSEHKMASKQLALDAEGAPQ